MNYIDYDEWVDVIQDVLSPYEPGPRWLDISCGTASMAVRLAQHGKSLTGVDLSPEMVDMAREKAASESVSISFFKGDMRDWQAESGFNVVLNVHDGLNYLLEVTDVEQFLSNAHGLLLPGGVLMFDVATPLLCQQHFHGYHEMFMDEEGTYERVTGYDPHSRIAETSFNVLSESGEAEVELHRQRAYDMLEVKELCDKSDFSSYQVLDDDTLEPADEKTERLMVILQRSK